MSFSVQKVAFKTDDLLGVFIKIVFIVTIIYCSPGSVLVEPVRSQFLFALFVCLSSIIIAEFWILQYLLFLLLLDDSVKATVHLSKS